MNCKHFAVHINEIVFIAACLEFVHFENYRFICQLLSKICGICITTLYGSIFLGYLGCDVTVVVAIVFVRYL